MEKETWFQPCWNSLPSGEGRQGNEYQTVAPEEAPQENAT